MSYYILQDGQRLYYEDKGHGPDTLIMMHGWTSSHEIFLKPTDSLQDHARCIVYDHRGHGESKKANRGSPTMETLASDLNEIIHGLSLSDVTLLGWSMGAGTAMTYIKKYGCSALKQVVLCDMTPKQLNDDDWKLGLYKGRYTKENAEADAGNNFLTNYRNFSIGAKPVCEKLPVFILDHILKKRLMYCDEKVLRSLSSSMKTQDNRDFVEKLDVPLTYFYAVPGSLFSPDLAEWYKDNVKVPFKAVPFQNSTHLLISENPDKFAREVAELLK